MTFKRKPEDNNNFYKYLWRVGTAVENGSAGCSWNEAGKKINREWHNNCTSSAYRKPVQYALKFYKHVFSDMIYGDEEAVRIREQMDELYKLKRQYFDQKREYNNLLVKDARAEHLLEIVSDLADKMSAEDFDLFKEASEKEVVVSDREAILCISDWHFGMTADNVWNKFDSDICQQRVGELVSKAIEIIERHEVATLRVVCLGDLIHGAIHTGCRVTSDELTSDQIIKVSELLSGVINILSKYVNKTYVYTTIGNHARTVQNKKDSVYDDNMEKIVPWYLTERFKDNENIDIVVSEFTGIILFESCDRVVFAVHGDTDKFNKLATTANMISTRALGKTVDYTLSGDKHNSKEYDEYGIEAIQIGSLCGTDEYANKHRLYSNASQTMMIFSPEDGRECTYNIKFQGRSE